MVNLESFLAWASISTRQGSPCGTVEWEVLSGFTRAALRFTRRRSTCDVGEPLLRRSLYSVEMRDAYRGPEAAFAYGGFLPYSCLQRNF
jgi:hypothetical protein